MGDHSNHPYLQGIECDPIVEDTHYSWWYWFSIFICQKIIFSIQLYGYLFDFYVLVTFHMLMDIYSMMSNNQLLQEAS